jgi:hypothetical protein
MNPFPSFISLTSNIDELEFKPLKIELCLDNSRRSDSTSQDILLRWYIAVFENSFNIIKETMII